MHSKIVEFINSKVGDAGAVLNEATSGDSSISVNPLVIEDVCRTLRDSDDYQFNVLQVITAADYPEYIELSYIIASFIKNTELILKAKLDKAGDELPKIKTVSGVWKAANYLERECYDMMGIDFVDHPDPRRILCPDDWIGYPLRKDYQAPDEYNGIKVSPDNKTNLADREFAAKEKARKAAEQDVANSETKQE